METADYSETPWLDPDAQPIVQIQGLSKRYGETAAVDAIDLDVYAGDEEGRERPVELTSLPNVVMTPHTSPRTDVSHMFALDLFCGNLERFLKGEPLVNVVDWDRGY